MLIFVALIGLIGFLIQTILVEILIELTIHVLEEPLKLSEFRISTQAIDEFILVRFVFPVLRVVGVIIFVRVHLVIGIAIELLRIEHKLLRGQGVQPRAVIELKRIELGRSIAGVFYGVIEIGGKTKLIGSRAQIIAYLVVDQVSEIEIFRPTDKVVDLKL